MQNVYDIRKEESLYYVLPTKEKKIKADLFSDALIAVYLYYEESVSIYIDIIRNLNDISVLFIVVSERLKDIIRDKIGDRKNTSIIIKENRGRDISALLMVAGEEAKKYKYLCYIHDKKEKNKKTKQDVASWSYGMWKNLIFSNSYIYNVLKVFNNSEMGLLLPMIPCGDYYNVESIGGWSGNFRNVVKLKDILELEANISENIPPISFGTMFWCKVDALRKIFLYKWTYDDFPAEPLPDDNTINHAIERILPYVAQDAGYKTGTIMTDEFASRHIARMQHRDRLFTSIARGKLGIYTPDLLENIESYTENINDFCRKKEKIYLYGAGEIGNAAYMFMKNFADRIPDGYIDRGLYGQAVNGLPIYRIEDICCDEQIGIIISVGPSLIYEIMNLLDGKYDYTTFLQFDKSNYD